MKVYTLYTSYFASAYAYADKLAILPPSASAIRLMLRCYESFASLSSPLLRHSLSSSAHAAGLFTRSS